MGQSKAVVEFEIPVGTLHYWITAAKKGEFDMVQGKQNPETGITLVAEMKQLIRTIKSLKKANALLRKENEFLEESSAFFAASRRNANKRE